ncbi:hypothetical protein BDV28DRAFT_126802 [Aspergillus coremiiformis]|uniref:Uncharacterized protein n=1 Tax=Aspergillus coremiiformis TaxID=138285 RepID=A0A5N6ZG00_9EURO|nr:hypothetical protein BDV28DRAFT_126802 [Aspergillus coremiiformis]
MTGSWMDERSRSFLSCARMIGSCSMYGLYRLLLVGFKDPPKALHFSHTLFLFGLLWLARFILEICVPDWAQYIRWERCIVMMKCHV